MTYQQFIDQLNVICYDINTSTNLTFHLRYSSHYDRIFRVRKEYKDTYVIAIMCNSREKLDFENYYNEINRYISRIVAKYN